MKSRKNKGYKIQNYGRIFDDSTRKKKKRVRNTVIFVLVILVLVFLGYSMAGPLKNLLNGEKTEVSSNPTSQISSQSITSSQIAKPETQNPVKPLNISEYKLCYLSREMAQNEAMLSKFLNDAKTLGYNAVVIEFKDEVGNIYFNTANEMAKSVGAVSSSIVDAKAICEKITAAGFTPIAEIHAFRDRIATKNSDAKIKYEGKDGWSWFDSANGNPWLNPYSTVAQNYITSLSLELASAGFENIMVSSVMFPKVNGFKFADFGAEEKSVSHSEILARYTTDLKTALSQKNVKLWLGYDGEAAKLPSNVIYGGVDPKLKLAADVFVPTISLVSDKGAALSQYVAEAKTVKPELNLVVKFEPSDISGAPFTKQEIIDQKAACKGAGVYVVNKTSNYIG